MFCASRLSLARLKGLSATSSVSGVRRTVMKEQQYGVRGSSVTVRRMSSTADGQPRHAGGGFGSLITSMIQTLIFVAAIDYAVSFLKPKQAPNEKDLMINTIIAKVNDEKWYEELEAQVKASADIKATLKDAIHKKIIFSKELESREMRVLSKLNDKQSSTSSTPSLSSSTASKPPTTAPVTQPAPSRANSDEWTEQAAAFDTRDSYAPPDGGFTSADANEDRWRGASTDKYDVSYDDKKQW